MQFETLCKHTIDEDFCKCETDKLEIVDENAMENVFREFQVTKYITREVEAPDTLSISKESN